MTNTTCQFCNIEHETTVPTVHLNGTSAEELRDQLHTVIGALNAAHYALVAAAPNGRDYYLQGAIARGRAMGAHERRCADLTRMLAELKEQRDHVQAVLDFKAEQQRADFQARIREVKVVADLPTIWDEEAR
jgi:hypothetical protein